MFLKKTFNCIAHDDAMVYFSCTMASQANPKKEPSTTCPHLRLVLETTPGAEYLTGEYVCDECGQQFHQPPPKQPDENHKETLPG
jgi:hypothetical protein